MENFLKLFFWITQLERSKGRWIQAGKEIIPDYIVVTWFILYILGLISLLGLIIWTLMIQKF